MWKFMFFAALLCLSLSSEASEKDLILLINQRLALMKDVAANKAINHQAIEDVVQEQNVLAITLEQAKQKGIDPDSIKPFIQAQMDAAKAIQYRYRADWLSQPENNWKPKDLSIVRAEISQLSSKVIDSIATELYQHRDLTDISSEQFAHLVHQKNLTDLDKQRILNALKQVQLR